MTAPVCRHHSAPSFAPQSTLLKKISEGLGSAELESCAADIGKGEEDGLTSRGEQCPGDTGRTFARLIGRKSSQEVARSYTILATYSPSTL